VVAVDRGGPSCLIDHGETGLLAAPEVSALADGVISLTTTPRLHDRVRRGALAGVRGRGWEAALDRLAAAYRVALAARSDQRLERGVA
jgi:glycosyltransferase involved in cell wall biosynthesis